MSSTVPLHADDCRPPRDEYRGASQQIVKNLVTGRYFRVILRMV